MASLHMRTWFNALPSGHRGGAASFGRLEFTRSPTWKKARGGAGSAGTPYALAKDGLPRERNSRPPDARALSLEGVRGQAPLLLGPPEDSQMKKGSPVVGDRAPRRIGTVGEG